MKDFGVVILTYPGDYHLSRVLIKSIEFFNPDINIAVLPGTGFNINDHPFKGYQLVEPPKEIKATYPDYYDRKFWAFFSPFKRFLYCDADVICLRPFAKELAELKVKEKKFIYANLPNIYYGQLENGEDDRKKKINDGKQLGELESIKAFDATYDYYDNYLINSGLFMSEIESISTEELVGFRRKEIEFYKTNLNKNYSPKSLYDLFYGDQGRLNYLIYSLKLNLYSLYPIAHYQWGGNAFKKDMKSVLDARSEIPFIHWAGCPKPSYSVFNKGYLFNLLIKSYGNLGYTSQEQKKIPGYELWKFFDQEKSISRAIDDSLKEFRKFIWPYLKGQLRRMLL